MYTKKMSTGYSSFVMWALTAICLGVFMLPSFVDASTPSKKDLEEYRTIRKDLERAVRKKFVVPSKYHSLRVWFDGKPLSLPKSGTIDIQSGFGHAAMFTFLRLHWKGKRVFCERLKWWGRSRNPKGKATLHRTTTKHTRLKRLFRAIQLLPTLRTKITYKPPPGLGSGSGGSTSTDFFLHIHVRNAKGKTLLQRSFVGYKSLHNQLRYLGLQAIHGIAAKSFSGKWTWRAVNVAEWRQSHFTDAYIQNYKVMVGPFGWWVMEYSLNILAAFGNSKALKTIHLVRDKYPKLLPRQKKKLDRLLKEPKHWLTGAPKWTSLGK